MPDNQESTTDNLLEPMHLFTIVAFACLFWRAEGTSGWSLIAADDVLWTLVIALAQPPAFGLAAVWAARRSRRLLAERADAPNLSQLSHHRTTLLLRTALVLGFAFTVLCTPWTDLFAFGGVTPELQIAGDLIVLSPYFAGAIALWLAAYPAERALHDPQDASLSGDRPSDAGGWRLRSYLDFNIRHHLLVVAVPLTLILFMANLTRGYGSELRRWSGWIWTPDAVLGASAAVVFILAPLLLRRIWRTVPLEPGPVRERLEAMCSRIGLRCRDILVWKSDGIMFNAAVMGLLGPLRYVMLSDALLETMTPKQIEAVFGHEAGHVRHRHIQHFLVFALVGWLVVAIVMEWLVRATADMNSGSGLSPVLIQGAGVGATLLFWGFGFGWVSRRFERQADLFGARCVTPPEDQCGYPCSVHPDAATRVGQDGRVCATGAAVFCAALERVAYLNGLPREERSWRHSSIGSRIRFLLSVAGDPGRAVRFERAIRRIKAVMLTAAVIGAAGSLYYWSVYAEPALFQFHAGVR